MNKRGALIEISAILILALTTLGTIYTLHQTSHLYVGNTATKEYFDFFECKEIATAIPSETLITFNSVEEATAKGYIFSAQCT